MRGCRSFQPGPRGSGLKSQLTCPLSRLLCYQRADRKDSEEEAVPGTRRPKTQLHVLQEGVSTSGVGWECFWAAARALVGLLWWELAQVLVDTKPAVPLPACL